MRDLKDLFRITIAFFVFAVGVLITIGFVVTGPAP